MPCIKKQCYFCQVYAARVNKKGYKSCKCPCQVRNRAINLNDNVKRCIPNRRGCKMQEGSFGITEAGFGPTDC